MRRLLSVLVSFLAIISVNGYAEDAPSNAFSLSTTAFLDQGAIPVLYTCDDKNLSPELTWANVPAKTQSLALLLVDPDAPGGNFYHWVLYNIPKSVTTLPEGADKLPSGVLAGKNSWNKLQYNGPCPPKGKAHSYIFTLYALDNKLSLPAGADGKTVLNAIQKHTVGKVELTAVYVRWLK